jgi:hypothetical protein
MPSNGMCPNLYSMAKVAVYRKVVIRTKDGFYIRSRVELVDFKPPETKRERERRLERRIVARLSQLGRIYLRKTQLQKLAQLRRKEFRAIFRRLVAEGILERRGRGRRKDPFLYLLSKTYRENPMQVLEHRRSKLCFA